MVVSQLNHEKATITERRRFLSLMAQSVGLSALGGLVWTGYIEEAKASPLILRPPGALYENDFMRLCIKCGQCVEACPYDTLRLAVPGENKPLGTPFFIPREVPCHMCTDIPCVPVCPTGALNKSSVSSIKEGEEKLDIFKAKMGLAVVDTESCIAFWGIQCDACYRACPVMDSAIKLEYRRNTRTGKHAYLIPIVSSDTCTGCGLCERACVTEKAAIHVLPNEVAQGKLGAHYIKGWEKADEKRLENVSQEVTTHTKRSEKKVEDYLNSGEDLFK
ncbi:MULTISPECIES: ferredoxin-type protein NapG [Sulfurospirillum]|uniref:ferredoxin-type protein NapG n=1 Tax=Sulfurospirillum sp. hDNRA2 TaxID=3237298 RepID=UPI0011981DEC|nr:ferredoxin-type protein NapG [Sulfurospirillum cavolei]MCR1810584.1 ferredoxin-type protein NapG [Sulfurospirillum sp. DNRA8]